MFRLPVISIAVQQDAILASSQTCVPVPWLEQSLFWDDAVEEKRRVGSSSKKEVGGVSRREELERKDRGEHTHLCVLDPTQPKRVASVDVGIRQRGTPQTTWELVDMALSPDRTWSCRDVLRCSLSHWPARRWIHDTFARRFSSQIFQSSR